MNTDITLPCATELKAARNIALAVQDERWYQELVVDILLGLQAGDSLNATT